jgi:hypothetical protein
MAGRKTQATTGISESEGEGAAKQAKNVKMRHFQRRLQGVDIARIGDICPENRSFSRRNPLVFLDNS